jgi:hypothetical protein
MSGEHVALRAYIDHLESCWWCGGDDNEGCKEGNELRVAALGETRVDAIRRKRTATPHPLRKAPDDG